MIPSYVTIMGEEKNGEGKLTPNCHGSDVTYVISVYNAKLVICPQCS